MLARHHFAEHGYTVPEKVRCTCGWPSRQALSNVKRRIGECWSESSSADGTIEIFISPVLSDSVRVLGVLVHEMVHAIVGAEAKHGRPFAECAEKVGLVKPWTATTESEALIETLESWVRDTLGPYPHAPMSHSKTATQSTRMLKMECSDCGCIIRTTQKWLDAYGPEWPCPCGDKLTESQ